MSIPNFKYPLHGCGNVPQKQEYLEAFRVGISNKMGKLLVPILFLCYLFQISNSLLNPTNLRVEYLENPEAVDGPRPRLSWVLEAGLTKNKTLPRNMAQHAYQVLVAASPELLVVGKKHLWNTDIVTSDQTFDIRYRGKTLEPGQKVFWTVRVWDQNGEASEFAKVSICLNLWNFIIEINV